MADNLKPCPFCGGEPKVYTDYQKSVDVEEPELVWRVMCGKLNCALLMSHFKTEEEAVATWNRRAEND